MSESGFPQCCGEDMFPLYQSRKFWCRDCDKHVPMPSLLDADDYERETYEGRIICDKLEQGVGYAGSGSLDNHVRQMRDPECWVHSSKDRWHQAYVDAKGYYLQDTRPTVGNCTLWWAQGQCGYTTDLAKAHVFTQKELPKDRETDVPWPKAVVDRLSVRHCRMESLREWRSQQGEENE